MTAKVGKVTVVGKEFTYTLLPASQSWLRRLLAALYMVPMERVWMTYRLPFQGAVQITYPDAVEKPMASRLVSHELIHARWLAKWWGPVAGLLLAALVPLPIFFSGRWFIERHAHLHDIEAGYCTVEKAADRLWNKYLWAWPRPLMRRWFEKKTRAKWLPEERR
jgi:hypothetical protein